MKIKKIIGWITYTSALIIIAIWSYWGINEAFHEGWYHTSLLQNISLTLIQYMSIPIIFLIISLIALNYKKTGFASFISLAIFAVFFFNSNAGRLLILIPLLLFAFGFYFGYSKHTKLISISYIAVFLLITLAFGIPQLIRVENRVNDNNLGLRVIEGNGITLTWAPQGPGFPKDGTDWYTAKGNCARLNKEGTILAIEQNIWRLPTREELVRSLTKNNNNSGGIMDSGNPIYQVNPDKETPLWNPNSKIIYYWTNDSDIEKAYLVSYNGNILERTKSSGPTYQGYRCVR